MQIRPIRTKADYRATLKEVEALIASRPEEVSTKTVEDAVAAAALMGMTNVFYRFRHLVGKPSYEQKPARLRTLRNDRHTLNIDLFDYFKRNLLSDLRCGRGQIFRQPQFDRGAVLQGVWWWRLARCRYRGAHRSRRRLILTDGEIAGCRENYKEGS